MGVAASGAITFYHSMMQEVQEGHHTIQADITLIRIFDDRMVHADIVISAPVGEISLGGAVSPVLLYDGDGIVYGNLAHQASVIPDGGQIIIRYVGPLNMTKPVDIGDTVHVVINHEFGQDVIPVRVS